MPPDSARYDRFCRSECVRGGSKASHSRKYRVIDRRLWAVWLQVGGKPGGVRWKAERYPGGLQARPAPILPNSEGLACMQEGVCSRRFASVVCGFSQPACRGGIPAMGWRIPQLSASPAQVSSYPGLPQLLGGLKHGVCRVIFDF